MSAIIIFLGLAGLLSATLAVPLHLKATGQLGHDGEFRVQWLGFRRTFKKQFDLRDGAGSPCESCRMRRQIRREQIMARIARIAQTKGFVRRTSAWVRNLLSNCDAASAEGRLIVGFSDPALTSILVAVVATLPSFTRHEMNLEIEPDFSGARFTGWYDVAITMRPINAIMPTFRYILSEPARKAIRRGFVRRTSPAE